MEWNGCRGDTIGLYTDLVGGRVVDGYIFQYLPITV